MSIKKLVTEKIAEIRGMISTWDNPAASQQEKGKVLAKLLGNEPKFWSEVAKRASAPKRVKSTTMRVEEIAQTAPQPATTTKKVVAVQKARTSTMAPPTPAKPVPATAPARMLRAQPKSAGISDFAAKLNGVAKQVGLEDHTPLARFRELLTMKCLQSGQYWHDLRELLEVVLRERMIEEISDWKLLVAKAKENLFFGGKKGEAFLAQCPKEGIANLLLADDGLWNLIDDIRREEEMSPSSPFDVGFVIDACVVVGKEAKELLTDCKHAVNRMKQRGFIAQDHWLVQKVAAMKMSAPRHSVAPASETSVNEAATDHKLEKLQQVAEATAAEVPAEKPETLGPVTDAQFEAAMMAAVGEVVPDMATMSEADLEKLTAPTATVN